MKQFNRILGGVLLVSGTCIGAGMLALPVTSAPSGFLLSVLLLFICWVFTYYIGLLVVEVNFYLPGQPSYVSMAKQTLGYGGKILTGFSFLFLFYSLLAAYISGGGALLLSALHALGVTEKNTSLGAVPWVLIFGVIVFLGAQVIDYVNRGFMLGLVIVFSVLIAISVPHLDTQLLTQPGRAANMWFALPILLTSFGYHIVVPSLRFYVDGNISTLKKIILWGSLLTLCVYLIWETIVFGVIPIGGMDGLESILKTKEAVTGLTGALAERVQSPLVAIFSRFFAFFAIATSFLGVSYGLFDLLADGLNIKKNYWGRVKLIIFTFGPPLLYALTYPKGFIMALNYAALFVAVLHGLLPVAMAYAGRKKITRDILYRAPGGMLFLIIAGLFFLFVIMADVAAGLHWLKAPQ